MRMTEASSTPPGLPTSAVQPEAGGTLPIRVLIVDDYDPVRRGIRLLLSSVASISICGEAIDGVEAIEKAQELHPDLILMDVTMPRMDGVEATRIIKQALPGTRVLVVSQHDPAIAQQEAAEIDADGFVAKSELSQQLIPAIGNLFAKRGLEPGPSSASTTNTAT